VPNCGDKTITRLDLKTGGVTATIPCPIGNSEGSIAAGGGSVWIVTDARGTLARIDPATNTIVAEVYVAPGSYGLTYGEDALWVTSGERNIVSRVDPHTNLVVGNDRGRQGAALHRGRRRRVWTLNQGDGSVSRIDPATNKVVATIEVGVPGGGGRYRGRRRIGVGDGVRVSAVAESIRRRTRSFSSSPAKAATRSASASARCGSRIWKPATSGGSIRAACWRPFRITPCPSNRFSLQDAGSTSSKRCTPPADPPVTCPSWQGRPISRSCYRDLP
jgi:YVTN family beta-propeller protein